MPKDLHELPKFKDGLSYVYLERCRIDQDDKSISCSDLQGVMKIPCASLAVIMLGPGTTVTHEAMKTIVQNGGLVLWLGEDGVRFYAQGMGETRSARRMIRQAKLVSDPSLRLSVVKAMYVKRFGVSERLDGLNLEAIRGMEGVRVRTAYAQASKKYGVAWEGRSYKRDSWSSADPINRALSSANSCLYGICHAAIVSAGYSPALGFIHSGKQLSFVYDIADLYKTEVCIPAAFGAVANGTDDLERKVRINLRDSFRESRIMAKIVDDIGELIGEDPVEEEDDFATDASRPAPLWDEPDGLAMKKEKDADNDT